MEIISHANVMPWPVEPSFFVELVVQVLQGVFLLSCAGLGYAGLRHLLSNGAEPWRPLSELTGGMQGTGEVLKYSLKETGQEEICDEA